VAGTKQRAGFAVFAVSIAATLVATLGKLCRFPNGDGVPLSLSEDAMSQVKPRSSRSRRFGVDFEEEKVWISFYRGVGNPAIAVEVMNQLDIDEEMKRRHLALYLRCKESLRMQKSRQARNKRIGQFVRMVCHAVLVVPFATILKWLRLSRDLGVECLPEVRKEPAVRQVGHLSKEAEFAQAQSSFDDQAAPPAKAANAEPEVNQPSPR
jgi:hypothetical protein